MRTRDCCVHNVGTVSAGAKGKCAGAHSEFWIGGGGLLTLRPCVIYISFICVLHKSRHNYSCNITT